MKEPALTVYLKKGGEKRLRSGHLWVFSNEIAVHRGICHPR